MTVRAGLIEPGTAHPLGASVVAGGVNLCVYSKRATGIDVLLFDGPDDLVPGRVISLDPSVNRTGEYWHALVPFLGPGQLYAFAAHGPWAPENGERFDPTRVLLDPYGRGVVLPDGYRRVPAGLADATAVPMKSVVIDTSLYDWEGDEPICRPWRETVVYEAHLRGMTADPSSGVAAGRRGTYAGFVEKIPYLVDLGVTAVELLPVFQFDPLAAPSRARQLLGLPAGLVLRPARGLRQPAGPDRGGGRVPRPGQGLPSGRSRGHPRRRLQPHRGGRRGRPDVLVPWPRQRGLLPARRRRPGALRGLQRDRQHAQRQRPDRPPADPRQPPLLGRGDARRRLPLRPRRDPVAWRGSASP